MCRDIILGSGYLAPGSPYVKRLKLEIGDSVVLANDIHHSVLAEVDEHNKLTITSKMQPGATEGNFQPATWCADSKRWTYTNDNNARGLKSMQVRILNRGEKRKYRKTSRFEILK